MGYDAGLTPCLLDSRFLTIMAAAMTATQAATDQHQPAVVPVSEPVAPSWVLDLPGLATTRPVQIAGEPLECRMAIGQPFSRLEVAFGGVSEMDILTFQQTVAEAYRTIFEQLASLPTPYPIRFWAFVPGIHCAMGVSLDRYMAFNAGRYNAYSTWCGGRDALGASVATASAIGYGEDRLVIHCLAASQPGSPLENPRQVPAYRYSKRYGPLPPCFARATAIGDGLFSQRRLLVGGTASIRGEDSLHVGDLRRQTEETLRNMSSLVSTACEGKRSADEEERASLPWLGRFRELRIYRPREEDTEEILGIVTPVFSAVDRIELVEAELCRRDLLVELEGVATVGHSGAAASW